MKREREREREREKATAREKIYEIHKLLQSIIAEYEQSYQTNYAVKSWLA